MKALLRPVVVAQADARRRGGHRAPLSVGVVRWRGAEPRLAVVAKLTLGLQPGDDGRLPVLEPQPVGPAVPGTEGDSLEVSSDFVVRKPSCDVTVVGHAHAPEDTTEIPVRVAVGEAERRGLARAQPAARSIPLTHLRTLDDRERLELAPQARPRETEDDGFDDYDHRRQQTAEWQLLTVAADARLALTGVSPRRQHLEGLLPGLAPRVLCDEPRGLLDLSLFLDTIHLDTDYERLTLSWRAVLPVHVRMIHRLLVSLEPADEPRDLDRVLADLPRGTIDWAAEEVPLEGDQEELELVSYEVLEHAAPPEMALESYAACAARVAEQDRPREEILKELELSERAWSIEERAWTEHMGDRAMAGDGTVAAEFAALFLTAQDALKKEHEPRPEDFYVELKAALERVEKPNELLEERGVPFGEWMRLERHYGDRAASDPRFARALEDKIREARRAARAAT